MSSITQDEKMKDFIDQDNIFDIMEEAMGPLDRDFVLGDSFELVIQPDGTIFGLGERDNGLFPAARAFQKLNNINYCGDTYASDWFQFYGYAILSSEFYDGPSGGKRRCTVVFPRKVTEQLLSCISEILSFTSADGRAFYNRITLILGGNYVEISAENLPQKIDYNSIRGVIDDYVATYGIQIEYPEQEFQK